MKKTQAFLVMSFVITFALAIGFFMQMEDEKDTRIRAEKMLGSVMKERDNIRLEMNAKIQEREKLIARLTASLHKEKIINSKLTENLDRSGKRASLAANRVKNPVELEKIVISSLLEAEGKVLAIDKQNDLIVVNLGSMDNLKSGDRLSVYRGEDFIANAQLVKVQDRLSAAMVLPGQDSKSVNVEINDKVK